MSETVTPYCIREATSEDLREFWRATNQLETFAEFEQRVTGQAGLACLLSLLRDSELLGLLEAHTFPAGEVWLGVSPVRPYAQECGRAVLGAVGGVLAEGCPRVWLCFTAPDVAAAFLLCGWQAAHAILWQRTDGAVITGQWLSLGRETWLRAQFAALN